MGAQLPRQFSLIAGVDQERLSSNRLHDSFCAVPPEHLEVGWEVEAVDDDVQVDPDHLVPLREVRHLECHLSGTDIEHLQSLEPHVEPFGRESLDFVESLDSECNLPRHVACQVDGKVSRLSNELDEPAAFGCVRLQGPTCIRGLSTTQLRLDERVIPSAHASLYDETVRSEPLTRRRTPVPFLDLGPSHTGLKPAIQRDIARLIDEGTFTNGPQVAAFEQAFSAYCGTDDCVGVASGLDALRLAMLAAGIERGDEVIVPAATFPATLEAVTQAGGRPVIADVDEVDYCLGLEAAAASLSAKTRF